MRRLFVGGANALQLEAAQRLGRASEVRLHADDLPALLDDDLVELFILTLEERELAFQLFKALVQINRAG
jgi:hypothetical protein